MAKHKAPTQVEVAPLFEKSNLEKAIDKYKMPALAVVVAVSGWVIFNHYRKQQAHDTIDKSWDTLLSQTTPDPFSGLPSATPARLKLLADELKNTESGPWARLFEAERCLDAREYDAAAAALDALTRDFPNHLLNQRKFDLETGSATAVERLRQIVADRKAWDAAHPGVFANLPPPADAPRVELDTSAGKIVLALYTDKAPKHAENFLKLCKEGFYDGLKFHRILRDTMVQAGDPNSKSDDTATWGQGGPGYKLDAEKNDLAHFAGVLSAAKLSGDTQSSGSQFFITVGDTHAYDGQYVIFGSVVEGLDVAKRISEATLAAKTSDRPESPVIIQSAKILNG